MISAAISKTQVAGDYLTKFLNKLLDRKNEKLVLDSQYKIARHYKLSSSSEKETVRAIKEMLGFVALDYNDALKKYNEGSPEFEKRVLLPDGNIITLDRERF